jgi:hypothetical protein
MYINILMVRGGLAPQIMVGFFFKGPKKKNADHKKGKNVKKRAIGGKRPQITQIKLS